MEILIIKIGGWIDKMSFDDEYPLELIYEKIDKINAVGLVNPISADELKVALEMEKNNDDR